MATPTKKAEPSRHTVSRLSWSALFGGTAVSLTTVMMLVLLGASIGFYTIEPASEENPFGGLAAGSAFWWLLSWIVALFLGGWIASRFGGLQRKFDGALHGIVTWALTFLVSFLLLTNTMGMILGGTFGVMQNVFSAAGQAISAVAPQLSEVLTGSQDPIKALTREAKQIIETVRQRGGENAVAQLTSTIEQVFAKPEITPADRRSIVDILVQYADMSEKEARSTVDRWTNRYQQLKQTVQQYDEQLARTAQQYSDALGGAAIASFFALLLGAAAAAFGGMAGRVKGAVRID